jgi:hypothetical protein
MQQNKFTDMNLILVLAAGFALAIVAGAQDFHHRKLQPANKGVIPGEYIVELYPQYNPRDKALQLIQGSMSGGGSAPQAKVTNYYDKALNGFAVKGLADSELQEFLDNPEVKAVWKVSIELIMCNYLVARCEQIVIQYACNRLL